jgi:hypothetical protein
MDENNVGQIRLEDSLYEAKIHEPSQINYADPKSIGKVGNSDESSKDLHVSSVERNAQEFRDG